MSGALKIKGFCAYEKRTNFANSPNRHRCCRCIWLHSERQFSYGSLLARGGNINNGRNMVDINSLVGQIIEADCEEVLAQLPDKCVDLVLTDPPYGIGFDKENLSMSCGMRVDGSKRKYNEWACPTPVGYSAKEWDSSRPSDAIIQEMRRVSKNQIVWGGNYFSLPVSGSWIVWDKGVVMPTLSKCELAWCSIGAHIEIFRYLWAGFRKEAPEERYHPTQKPVPLFKWCLSNYSSEGMLILDPFSGSGTTALACHALNRRFICIEREHEYVEISRNRLRDAQAQMSLFPNSAKTEDCGSAEHSLQQPQLDMRLT
jgi:site-specific DNA-methyltransferase (adenine-specific)